MRRSHLCDLPVHFYPGLALLPDFQEHGLGFRSELPRRLHPHPLKSNWMSLRTQLPELCWPHPLSTPNPQQSGRLQVPRQRQQWQQFWQRSHNMSQPCYYLPLPGRSPRHKILSSANVPTDLPPLNLWLFERCPRHPKTPRPSWPSVSFQMALLFHQKSWHAMTHLIKGSPPTHSNRESIVQRKGHKRAQCRLACTSWKWLEGCLVFLRQMGSEWFGEVWTKRNFLLTAVGGECEHLYNHRLESPYCNSVGIPR